MDYNYLKQIINNYLDGTITAEDEKELNDWFHSINMPQASLDSWIREKGSEELLANELFDDFQFRITKINKKPTTYKLWLWSAAAAVVLSVGVTFLLFNKKEATKNDVVQIAPKDVLPGVNKAILTLADGSTIEINENNNGLIATQGDMAINRNGEGTLVYQHSEGNTGEIGKVYNQMSTPRGGQYSLTLSDGTRVWLNAASSIKYPVKFTGNERSVEITGEVFFEVVHNNAMPFRVKVGGHVVEDLGTQFNINAYTDEAAVNTTLIEGKVKVMRGNENVMLKPGEQARVAQGKTIKVLEADTSEIIAWKNGLFRFQASNITTVMRQLSRWYNVDIEYVGEIPDRSFSGEITRSANFSEVVDILTFLKLQFTIRKENNRTILSIQS